MIHNRRVAAIFRGAAMAFSLVGLLAQMGVFEGHFRIASFMYYTIQSNLLAFILFVILFARTVKGLKQDGEYGEAGYFSRFEMVCTVDLLLTFLVYWVLLVPQSFSMDGDMNLWTFTNLAVHLITPLLCLVDYVLFAQPRRLQYKDVYAVVIYPLAYVLFTSIAGLAGYSYGTSAVDGSVTRFPYFFLDFDELGMTVFLYIFALVALFLVISHVMFLVDRKWKKPVWGAKAMN